MSSSRSSSAAATVGAIDREALAKWYRRNRLRSSALFDLIANDETYYSQPISLRHPLVFYEGHLPAFSFNTLVKKALGQASLDPDLELLFARGIDPDRATGLSPDAGRNSKLWPNRDRVRSFAAAADERVLQALQNADLDQPGHAFLDRAEAAFTILEHEAMHQETLLYMWHRLRLDQKRRPMGYQPRTDGEASRQDWIEVPEGRVTRGVDRHAVLFAWDNEQGPCSEQVGRFLVERHNVTNEAFLAFVDAGGYDQPQYWSADDWAWLQQEQVEHPLFWERIGSQWCWRGMFDRIPLPPAWPVYVSHAEATAYARWSDARLPTEAEFTRAAYGSPVGERVYPWGDTPPSARFGVFDFDSWDPEPAGSHPAGRSAWDIHDLAGNGWEWTSTPFAPFPGFQPRASYPEYSADFFDGQHFVMKGASPATASELIRPTFRNWFRPRYPYVYATFRCARDAR